MENNKFIAWLDNIWEWIKETIGGFTLTGIGSIIAPEIIHTGFVLLGGVLGTIAIHITRKRIIPKVDKLLDKIFLKK